MAQDVCVTVNAADRAHLAAIIDDRNRPLKHIQRAQIILFSAELGLAEPWPRLSACRCVPSNASGKRTAVRNAGSGMLISS